MTNPDQKRDEPTWEFRASFDSLKDAYKELIDSNQKIMGILLIVVGWFVSQKNPLTMICEFQWLAYFGIGATTFGLFALAYLFNSIYRRADRARQEVLQLGITRHLPDGYRVSRPMYWIGLFGQFTLLLGIATVLHHKYITKLSDTCEPGKFASAGLLLLISSATFPAYADDGLTGRWIATDSKTKVQVIIELQVRNEKMEGKVVSITRAGLPIDPICAKCDGQMKNVHIVGATFITNLKRQGSKWVQGTVVDIRPEEPGQFGTQGFVAHCDIELVNGKAEIFGWPYVFRFLGQKDTWERAP